MAYAALPGVRLWYTDTGGDGVPVIFLHAASGTSESWVYQEPAFTAAGYRCICYDRRGWGRSQPVMPDDPGNVSDDLQGLADHLGLGRFHLVATAAGGIAGLDYTLSYPERVRSLVIATTLGGVEDPGYLEVQHRLRPADIQALPVELRELGPGYRGLHPEGTRRWIEIERSTRPGGHDGPRQPLKQPMTYARLETMPVPVLAIAGGADLLSPPALMRLLVAHLPGSQFEILPEAGHAAFWEQPELWNRLVLDFIGQHPA
ncbi:alpha/beta fold hydrolase [Candidatus Entotheonella palauensis]|nr:alpha/beta hydrolase [Candidatus Entotheonella palauensis]